MKRMLAFILAFVLITVMFAGCHQDKENPETTKQTQDNNQTEDIALKLNPLTGSVWFGESAISGIQVPEPADLNTIGVSEMKTVSVKVGDNDSSYVVRTLGNFGAEMSFTLHGVTPNAPAMIDIEELHLRDDGAIAYSVYVNGVEVFGRTYDPNADGANHAFFDISAELVGNSDQLSIRIVNTSDQEVRFRRVWALSNPDSFANTQGISKKMDVVLMLNYMPNNLNYTYLKSLVESYQCDGMYNVGLCWEINYLQWGKEKTETYLNNVIAASIQTGAVLYLGINSWWGGTPAGPDGLGGMWQDVPYQQITYDKNNNDGRGQWQLSSPNEWSNTPWLSMNNDYYNAVRVQRIKETVAFIQLRTAELSLAGQNLPPIHLYTENEPYYWPINWNKFDFDNYPNGVGDFSEWVVADAAADGITLDPTDGLSEKEALWLYRNLNTYISEVGNAMADGLGYNYITIKDGVISYPTEQIVADSYSHSPIHSIYPNWNEDQRAWENHILNSIHFGGEWSVYQDQDSVRALDYLIAYGSFSNINAERAGFPGGFSSKDFRVLSQCYAYGLEGVVIYNVLADTDQQNVIGVSREENTPMDVRVYDSDPIYESDFTKRTAYGVNKVLTEISGFRWDGLAVLPNVVEGGSLTYRIANVENYTTGLRVITNGSFATEGGKLEVLVGSSLEDLKSVGIFDTAVQSVAIDPAMFAGSNEVYIRVRVYGDNLSVTQLSGLCLSSVGIYRAATTSGCTDGSRYTFAQNRVRCQLIAARADVERLLNAYMDRVGGHVTSETQKMNFERAYNLYANGCYGEAYAAICQAISQVLPANFTVAGYGQLGEYPVHIAVDNDAKVTVCLKEVAADMVRFSMTSSADTNVTVSLLTEHGKWAMTQQENGDWVISAGDVAASDGKVSFTVAQQERKAKEYPFEFEARLLLTDASNIYIQSQDTAVTDYCYYKEFQLAKDAVVYRGIDGTQKADMELCDVTQLKPGDYVQVRLNDNGRVTEVYAWYGVITGKVISVEEIVLFGTPSNAYVTVQAEDGTVKRLEISYDTLLTFTGATGEMGKLALVESLGLQVGQQITAYYCPYTFNDRTRAIEITD